VLQCAGTSGGTDGQRAPAQNAKGFIGSAACDRQKVELGNIKDSAMLRTDEVIE